MSLPTERTQVDSKGRIVIPARFRKSLSVQSGDTVEVFLYIDKLIIRKLSPEPTKALCVGCGKTEDDIKMKVKSTDGRIGICVTCDKKGLRIKEVNP